MRGSPPSPLLRAGNDYLGFSVTLTLLITIFSSGLSPGPVWALPMARTDDPNSAGSQFFICLDRKPYLDRKYTAFGKVADEASLAVVRTIGAAKTGPGDKPLEKIVINKVTVTEKPK